MICCVPIEKRMDVSIYCMYMTKLYGYDRNDDGIMLNKRIY